MKQSNVMHLFVLKSFSANNEFLVDDSKSGSTIKLAFCIAWVPFAVVLLFEINTNLLLSLWFDYANFHFDFCQIALQTVWKVGRDGIEAGTNLVPVSLFSFFSKSTLSNLLAVLWSKPSCIFLSGSTKLRYFFYIFRILYQGQWQGFLSQ